MMGREEEMQGVPRQLFASQEYLPDIFELAVSVKEPDRSSTDH